MCDSIVLPIPKQHATHELEHPHHVNTWTGRSPRIFALHGFTGVGDDYCALARALGHTFVAPDLLGHGRSAAPQTVQAYEASTIIKHLATLANPNDVLMGYSLGARLALEWTCSSESKPAALVLLSGTPGITDETLRATRQAEDDRRAQLIRESGTTIFLKAWQQTPLIRTQERASMELKERMDQGRALHQAHGLANVVASLSPGRMPDRLADLASIEIPTLLISGREDHKYTELAEMMQRALPNAHSVSLEGIGHAPHIEAPEETSHVIRQFLDEVSG